jgi:starvation-inducible DNA-binding protein
MKQKELNMKIEPILLNVLGHQYRLFIKTQSYHWNIEGPNFISLHEKFEEQYKELLELIDTTAEHIRALGIKVPNVYTLFLSDSKLNEGNENLSGSKMLYDLIQSHQVMEDILMAANTAVEEFGDPVISDFLIEGLTFHRKTLWILRSCC